MMKTPHDDGQGGNRLRIAIWGTAAGALLLPWVAMQFTTEVAWNLADFAVFGAMLLVVCGAYELATRLTASKAYRLALGIALVGAFLLTWINLAVGIIGNEGNPVNKVFFGILVIGLAGALIARFEPRGMAFALLATAIAQALVAVISLLAGWVPAVALSAFFTLLWLASAYLFRKASMEQSSAAAHR